MTEQQSTQKRRCQNCGKTAHSGIVVRNRLGLQGQWVCEECAEKYGLMGTLSKLSTDIR
jgi:ribosomal protein L37AE/L43A